MKTVFEGIAGAVRAKDGETCWRRHAILSLLARWRQEAPWWQRRVYEKIIQQVWDLPEYGNAPRVDATEAEQNPLGQWQ